MLEQSIVLAKQLDDPVTAAYSMQILGVAASFRGDLARAVSLLEEALRRYSEYDQHNCTAMAARVRLASARTFAGELAAAADLLEECRAICEPIGEQWVLSWALCGLSRLAQLQGEPAKAIDFALRCLRIKERFQDMVGSALVTEILAWSWASQGQGERAAVLLGAARQMWLAVGQPWFGSTDYAAPFQQGSALARDLIGDDAFEACFARGMTFSYEEALAYAGCGTGSRHHYRETTYPATSTPRECDVAELDGNHANTRSPRPRSDGVAGAPGRSPELNSAASPSSMTRSS
jgi:non-specific serine/threonine protein kinase